MAQTKKQIPYIDVKLISPTDKTLTKCAPHLKYDNGSCIPLEFLIKMANAYNKYHSNNPSKIIPLNESLEPVDYKKYLLLKFKNICKGEQKDWIDHDDFKFMSDNVKDYLENKVFRPDGPQGQFDWLSTIDINQVLYQYEEKYDDFKFLGAVPLDFIDLDYLPFKKLNFDDLYNAGIRRIGVIFNTDKSSGPGRHWISLLSDFSVGQIYFSDSMGRKPPKEVYDFMKLIEKYLKNKKCKNKVIDVKYNKTQHQQGNSECGVYSINFILRLLKGKTFEHITRKRLVDGQVNKCRIKYFGKTNK